MSLPTIAAFLCLFLIAGSTAAQAQPPPLTHEATATATTPAPVPSALPQDETRLRQDQAGPVNSTPFSGAPSGPTDGTMRALAPAGGMRAPLPELSN
ncbi:MAG: hypothetical protein JOY71_23060 [Acetobacteraceae bacterium]|nr:hypothetical protein [Acetobacteraceae bacterium]